MWQLGERVEYYGDPNARAFGLKGGRLGSGTLTIQASPTSNLAIMLDNRADFVLGADALAADGTTAQDKKIFQKKERDHASSMVTTTLGVIVKTK